MELDAPSASKRAVIRLQLDIEAKDRLDQICELRGMTQIAVLSRLVKWFSKQDEVIQAGVLNLLSEQTIGELTQGLLNKMASKAPTPTRDAMPRTLNGKAYVEPTHQRPRNPFQ